MKSLVIGSEVLSEKGNDLKCLEAQVLFTENTSSLIAPFSRRLLSEPVRAISSHLAVSLSKIFLLLSDGGQHVGVPRG